MQKFIKEEMCKGVYLMCGYSKGGNLYYCITKERKNGDNDIMFLNRFQFAKMLDNCFECYCVHSFINGTWRSSEYFKKFNACIDILNYEFPVEVNINEEK